MPYTLIRDFLEETLRPLVVVRGWRRRGIILFKLHQSESTPWFGSDWLNWIFLLLLPPAYVGWREGHVLTGVSLSTGGIPQSQVIFLVSGPKFLSRAGGRRGADTPISDSFPSLWSHVLSPGGIPFPNCGGGGGRGIPVSAQLGGGYPSPSQGYPPPSLGLVCPPLGLEYPPPPDWDWGTPMETEEQALAMRWAVFLLQSRRRTFLFNVNMPLSLHRTH